MASFHCCPDIFDSSLFCNQSVTREFNSSLVNELKEWKHLVLGHGPLVGLLVIQFCYTILYHVKFYNFIDWYIRTQLLFGRNTLIGSDWIKGST